MNATFSTACVLAATSGAAAALHRESDWYWWFEVQRWAAFSGAYSMFLWHRRRKNRNHFLLIIFVLVFWCALQTLAYQAIRHTGRARARPKIQPTLFYSARAAAFWAAAFFCATKKSPPGHDARRAENKQIYPYCYFPLRGRSRSKRSLSAATFTASASLSLTHKRISSCSEATVLL